MRKTKENNSARIPLIEGESLRSVMHDLIHDRPHAAETWKKVRALDTKATYTLGPNTTDRYLGDPKRLGFMLARYKFAAKMLRDCNHIIEVGCGDGFGTAMLLTNTGAQFIRGYDMDAELIAHAKRQLLPALRVKHGRKLASALSFQKADFMATEHLHADGAVCLDVWEHVEPAKSDAFIRKIAGSLVSNGVLVIGAPSDLSSVWASEHSRAGHINLKSSKEFEAELRKHFSNVFMFTAFDENITSGFYEAAPYLLAVAVK